MSFDFILAKKKDSIAEGHLWKKVNQEISADANVNEMDWLNLE